MIERPMLFSTEMVQAYQSGFKGKTRRTRGLDVINRHPNAWKFMGLGLNPVGDQTFLEAIFKNKGREILSIKCPYGMKGDRLWVRETAAKPYFGWIYRADGERQNVRWRPSIHMPRVACRYVLDIVDIRIERLQDISEKDALDEGIENTTFYRDEHPPSICYSVLWNAINGSESWAKNPWVWVIEFPKKIPGR